ncbi:unnamed protein product [Macrosiphum euphorbiae]|uniref:Uncharacterized protein n=1 Tax=Macrosiphum euphorbiae TaxID=13131 RepID=A0AAV0WC11_9HEMI|nr:unnamed protein product [Macrosiphum euphorbiae]
MPRQQIYLIGPMNNQITGSKLPFKRDCLSVLFYNMRLVNLNLHDSSRLVIDECSIFWKKARIPTHDNSDCIKKLKKLYEEWRKLDKNKTRTTELQKTHENKFEEQLDNLFDLSHANALNLIKIEEDKQFLLRQREKGRPGCMLGTDMKLAGIEKRKATLKENEDGRKKRRELETLKLTGKLLNIGNSIVYVFS